MQVRVMLVFAKPTSDDKVAEAPGEACKAAGCSLAHAAACAPPELNRLHLIDSPGGPIHGSKGVRSGCNPESSAHAVWKPQVASCCRPGGSGSGGGSAASWWRCRPVRFAAVAEGLPIRNSGGPPALRPAQVDRWAQLGQKSAKFTKQAGDMSQNELAAQQEAGRQPIGEELCRRWRCCRRQQR